MRLFIYKENGILHKARSVWRKKDETLAYNFPVCFLETYRNRFYLPVPLVDLPADQRHFLQRRQNLMSALHIVKRSHI